MRENGIQFIHFTPDAQSGSPKWPTLPPNELTNSLGLLWLHHLQVVPKTTLMDAGCAFRIPSCGAGMHSRCGAMAGERCRFRAQKHVFFLFLILLDLEYVPSKMGIYGHIMKYWVCILLDISWQYAHVFRCFLIFRELKTTLLGVGIERPSAMEVFSPKHLTHLAYQTFVNINWHRDLSRFFLNFWDLTEQMHIIDSSGTRSLGVVSTWYFFGALIYFWGTISTAASHTGGTMPLGRDVYGRSSGSNRWRYVSTISRPYFVRIFPYIVLI